MSDEIVRHSGSWMVLWDERILEIMLSDGPVTATDIANRDFIQVGRSNISKRLSKLQSHGLIDAFGNGVYDISYLGKAYLYGGYDAESEERIEFDPDNPDPMLDWVELYLNDRDNSDHFATFLLLLYETWKEGP